MLRTNVLLKFGTGIFRDILSRGHKFTAKYDIEGYVNIKGTVSRKITGVKSGSNR